MQVDDNEVTKYLSIFKEKISDYEIDQDEIIKLKQKVDEGDLESILKYADEMKNKLNNIKEAEHYYKLAAERGNEVGMYNYAFILLSKCENKIDKNEKKNRILNSLQIKEIQ